jgi:hypothetical protein
MPSARSDSEKLVDSFLLPGSGGSCVGPKRASGLAGVTTGGPLSGAKNTEARHYSVGNDADPICRSVKRLRRSNTTAGAFASSNKGHIANDRGPCGPTVRNWSLVRTVCDPKQCICCGPSHGACRSRHKSGICRPGPAVVSLRSME